MESGPLVPGDRSAVRIRDSGSSLPSRPALGRPWPVLRGLGLFGCFPVLPPASVGAPAVTRPRAWRALFLTSVVPAHTSHQQGTPWASGHLQRWAVCQDHPAPGRMALKPWEQHQGLPGPVVLPPGAQRRRRADSTSGRGVRAVTCPRQADPEPGGGWAAHWLAETQKPTQASASPSSPRLPHLSRGHPPERRTSARCPVSAPCRQDVSLGAAPAACSLRCGPRLHPELGWFSLSVCPPSAVGVLPAEQETQERPWGSDPLPAPLAPLFLRQPGTSGVWVFPSLNTCLQHLLLPSAPAPGRFLKGTQGPPSRALTCLRGSRTPSASRHLRCRPATCSSSSCPCWARPWPCLLLSSRAWRSVSTCSWVERHRPLGSAAGVASRGSRDTRHLPRPHARPGREEAKAGPGRVPGWTKPLSGRLSASEDTPTLPPLLPALE